MLMGLAGALTYALELSLNRGCSWASAKQQLDEFKATQASAGQAPSQHAGFYVDRSKQGWGKTGRSWCLASLREG